MRIIYCVLTIYLTFLLLPANGVASISACSKVWETQGQWQVADWLKQSCYHDGFYYLKLGRLYLKDKQYSKAINAAKQGISYADAYKSELKLIILDSVYQKNKTFDNETISKQLLEKYIAYYEQVEKSDEALGQIVRLAAGLGQHQMVMEYGSELLRNHPSIDYYSLVIRSYVATKDYKAANYYLEQAYEFDSNVLGDKLLIENAIEVSTALGDEKSERFYRIIAKKNGFKLTP